MEAAENFRVRVYRELPWLMQAIALVPGGNVYRLHLGPYRSQDEARSVADRIQSELSLRPVIVASSRYNRGPFRRDAPMPRFFFFLIFLLPVFASAQAPPQVAGRAWVVADISSGQILAAEKPDERFEPASLTKLMTAYVTFTALREKKLALEQQVNVSEKAWRASGSRMFIEPKKPVTADELIRGMIVQSGNDACVALAEQIAGSEEAFVGMMNREAERLGMKNTKFMNVSGLPDPQHYSTARDLYLLASALIRDFPAEYEQYYSMREFRYNGITQMNRNRLLWLDNTVDGMKTGFTDAAGYCLVASSKRGPRRLLSVLLGSTSESMRAQESQKLLNWGFQFFRRREALRGRRAGEGDRSLEGARNPPLRRDSRRPGGVRAQGPGRQAEGRHAFALAAGGAGRRGRARGQSARDAGR